MDKKFRNLILSQVEAVVHDRPAGRQSLYDLLKIATPDLKLHMVDNTSQREHAYRALKVIIHPDKHRKALKNNGVEMQRVTKIFQETSAYYNVCCARLSMESPSLQDNNSLEGDTPTKTPHRHNTPLRVNSGFDQASMSNKRDYRPPSIISFGEDMQLFHRDSMPVSFDAYEQWPYMNDMVKAPATDTTLLSTNELSWIMACRVINLRGACIHGQAIGRAYQVTKKSSDLEMCKTVEDVLRHFGFVASQRLRKIQDIKMEIMAHGPVLSTSFQLHKSFYQQQQSTSMTNKFSKNHVSKLHPLLLVGWSMSSLGELWKVQALDGGTFELGTGQFEISTTVVAPPASILETIPWQSTGPYLDLNMPSSVQSGRDWRDLRHMSISISAKELETFSKLLEGGFQQAIKNKQSFVIRDKHKLAYSRRYTLREITTGDNGKWKISISLASVS
jgi:hypothetical protein